MTGRFSLADVVPWGRCRAEYLSFFDLLDLAPGLRILDAGGGPSSFNAEMTTLGHTVISADPLYAYSKPAIVGQIEMTRDRIMAGVRSAMTQFIWDQVGTPEALESMRMAAMKLFLEDFEDGLAEGRYVVAGLPDLPFAHDHFDLALCSHFLFTYTEHKDRAFHLDALMALARVARDVRVFPLLDLDGTVSVHLAPVRGALEDAGYRCDVLPVGYEFQRGGNQMLRITR